MIVYRRSLTSRMLQGSDVAKAYGRALESVYQIKDALDLDSEQAVYHYVKRFVIHEMQESNADAKVVRIKPIVAGMR